MAGPVSTATRPVATALADHQAVAALVNFASDAAVQQALVAAGMPPDDQARVTAALSTLVVGAAQAAGACAPGPQPAATAEPPPAPNGHAPPGDAAQHEEDEADGFEDDDMLDPDQLQCLAEFEVSKQTGAAGTAEQPLDPEAKAARLTAAKARITAGFRARVNSPKIKTKKKAKKATT